MAEPQTKLPKFETDNFRFQEMLRLRYPVDAWAREINEYLLTHRLRWLMQSYQTYDSAFTYDHSFNENIFDSTAVLAIRTASAGWLEGCTSPASPWVALGVKDDAKAKLPPVKQYLDITNKATLAIYDQSNFYTQMLNHFLDYLCLPAAVTLIEKDPKYGLRFTTLSWGCYVLDVDENGDVNTIGREEEYEVRQLVPKFCKMMDNGEYDLSNLTDATADYWRTGTPESLNRRIMVRHIIRPNPDHDPSKPQDIYKKWISRYWEKSAPDESDKYLRQSGYDWFPAIVNRWNSRSQEIYANDCPALQVLSDIKQLYKNTEDQNFHLDKVLDPPLTGPEAFLVDVIQKGPGGFTPDNTTDAEKGLRPLYQITADIKWVNDKIGDLRAIINRGFFVDMFQALSVLRQRMTGQITAAEVDQLKAEKLVELGPNIQGVYRSLRHLIDVTYIIENEMGLIPPAPQMLAGQELPPEFISPFAMAQRAAVLSLYDKLMQTANGMIEAGFEDVKLIVNVRSILEKICKVFNLPWDTLNPEDVVNQMKQQMAAAQQAKTQQEGALAATGAAKNLSQADTGGDNLLTKMLAMSRAGQVAPQAGGQPMQAAA